KPAELTQSFVPGDGLLGQAVASKQTFLIHDVPAGYLQIGSAMGGGKPKDLLISPLHFARTANGVIELAFMRDVGGPTLQFVEQVAESIGIALRSAHYRANLHELLEETQRQAE